MQIFKFLWALYIFFIFYGALIPFNFDLTAASILSNINGIEIIPFVDSDGTRASIPDVVQNILFFIPFGLLGFVVNQWRGKIFIPFLVLMGLSLSFSVECLQILTIDRTSSVTDLITNSLGTFVGAVTGVNLSSLFLKLENNNRVQKLGNNIYFYPFCVAFALVFLGTLQPFDFTLDVGETFWKIKRFIKNPFDFSGTLRDEGVVFFRFFLFGYVSSLFLKKEFKVGTAKIVVITSLMGIILEGAQLIISSRVPAMRDAFVNVIAVIAGVIFTRVSLSLFTEKVWGAIIMLTVTITAAMDALSPYLPAKEYTPMNLFPFLPYYQVTTFIALSNFIDSFLIYFPLGFLMCFIIKKNRPPLIVLIALVISLPLEFAQGNILGRYPDITDIIGGLIGALAGEQCYKLAWKENEEKKA